MNNSQEKSCIDTESNVLPTLKDYDDSCNGIQGCSFKEDRRDNISTISDEPMLDGCSVNHPTSYTETLIHVLKGNVGPGLFSMGDAFKNCGLVLAPFLTLFLGLVCVHSQHLLLQASKEMKRRTAASELLSFADTIEIAFDTGPSQLAKYSTFFKKLVNVFLCVTQMGFCCVFFLFIAENLKQVLDFYDIVAELYIHMAVVLIPILLSCWIRDLKYLVPVSLGANILMFIGIIGTFVVMSSELPPAVDREFVADYSRVPLFFGTVIYAFEGIGLVLPLQAQMKKPRQFVMAAGVLNVGMIMVTILHITMGSLGYLQYGEGAKGSLTLNLPIDQVLPQLIRVTISLGIIFTFAIQMYVPFIIMWPAINNKYGPFKHPAILETIFRSVLVLITFFLAGVIPHLGLVISLIGAVSSTALALLFPAILDVVTRWETISRAGIAKDALIFLIGILGFLTGTYASMADVVRTVYQDKPT